MEAREAPCGGTRTRKRLREEHNLLAMCATASRRAILTFSWAARLGAVQDKRQRRGIADVPWAKFTQLQLGYLHQGLQNARKWLQSPKKAPLASSPGLGMVLGPEPDKVEHPDRHVSPRADAGMAAVGAVRTLDARPSASEAVSLPNACAGTQQQGPSCATPVGSIRQPSLLNQDTALRASTPTHDDGVPSALPVARSDTPCLRALRSQRPRPDDVVARTPVGPVTNLHELRASDLSRLTGSGMWLNDETVNFYMLLIMKRHDVGLQLQQQQLEQQQQQQQPEANGHPAVASPSTLPVPAPAGAVTSSGRGLQALPGAAAEAHNATAAGATCPVAQAANSAAAAAAAGVGAPVAPTTPPRSSLGRSPLSLAPTAAGRQDPMGTPAARRLVPAGTPAASLLQCATPRGLRSSVAGIPALAELLTPRGMRYPGAAAQQQQQPEAPLHAAPSGIMGAPGARDGALEAPSQRSAVKAASAMAGTGSDGPRVSSPAAGPAAGGGADRTLAQPGDLGLVTTEPTGPAWTPRASTQLSPPGTGSVIELSSDTTRSSAGAAGAPHGPSSGGGGVARASAAIGSAGGCCPRLSVYAFNSFLFSKLTGGGVRGRFEYEEVRRWTLTGRTRTPDCVLSRDLLIIPINHGNTHWCLAAVWPRRRVVQYYDSMAGTGGCTTITANTNTATPIFNTNTNTTTGGGLGARLGRRIGWGAQRGGVGRRAGSTAGAAAGGITPTADWVLDTLLRWVLRDMQDKGVNRGSVAEPAAQQPLGQVAGGEGVEGPGRTGAVTRSAAATMGAGGGGTQAEKAGGDACLEAAAVGWRKESCCWPLPRQLDGSSCGVFVCAFAELLARGVDPGSFKFSQADIPSLRRGMAEQILRAAL